MKRQPTPEERKSQERILYLIDEYCDGKQQIFADRVQIGKSSVSQYKKGTNFPTNKRAVQIAKAFNVQPMWVMGFDVPMREERSALSYENIFPIEEKAFPVLGAIACGEPILMTGERDLYVVSGTEVKADFVLYAKGDSMTGSRINDGDIVFIREQPMVENGEIAAVAIGDEATLKKFFYYPDKRRIKLRATNPNYEDLEFEGEDLRKVRVLGKAIAFQSDVN